MCHLVSGCKRWLLVSGTFNSFSYCSCLFQDRVLCDWFTNKAHASFGPFGLYCHSDSNMQVTYPTPSLFTLLLYGNMEMLCLVFYWCNSFRNGSWSIVRLMISLPIELPETICIASGLSGFRSNFYSVHVTIAYLSIGNLYVQGCFWVVWYLE